MNRVLGYRLTDIIGKDWKDFLMRGHVGIDDVRERMINSITGLNSPVHIPSSVGSALEICRECSMVLLCFDDALLVHGFCFLV